jgi:hypothetical protein
MRCPNCGFNYTDVTDLHEVVVVFQSDDTPISGWVCPDCESVIEIDDLVYCPHDVIFEDHCAICGRLLA